MNKPYIVYNLLKISVVLCFFGYFQVGAFCQTDSILTLSYCQSEAILNYPSVKDKELLKKASEFRLQGIETNLLPQMSLNGQATYQSDVINLPAGGPISIHQHKDQYKASLDINQTIFDGGSTRYQKKLEESGTASDIQQVEVDLFKIRDQVNNVYFLLISLQENEKLLKTVLNEITERKKVVVSSVNNGVLMQSDLDVLEAERLKTEQQLAEIDINRRSSLTILSILVNKPLNETVRFQLPVMEIKDSMQVVRPEYKLFEMQTQRIDDSKLLSKTLLLPKVSAFGQAGYGRPGLNMLNDKFNSYYMVGVTFKWVFFDWNKNSRDRQVLEVQKERIGIQRENFDRNLNIDLQNKLANIQKLEEAIARDSSIVAIRVRITHSSTSRLENGVITSTDYLTDLNAETSARINFETHKIQLEQAKTSYLLAKGIY